MSEVPEFISNIVCWTSLQCLAAWLVYFLFKIGVLR